MSRRIVTEQLQGKTNPPVDKYPDRLMKYIPTEAIGFWLAVSGIIQSAGEDIPKTPLLWVFFVLGVLLTFAWIFKQTQKPKKPTAWTQIGISCVAFVVWVLATGEPFSSLSFYRPVYGSLLLVTYTSLVTLVVPPEG